MDVLGWIRAAFDALRSVWAFHFRIPRALYWLSYLVGALLLADPLRTSPWLLGGGLFLMVFGAQGIARWHVLSNPRSAIAVAQFSSVAEARGRGLQVQRDVVATLRDRLRPLPELRVLAVPEVIGRADDQLAIRVRSRLRARYLLHGDVRGHADGSESVYARLVRPIERSIEHWDWFTRDRTPLKTPWTTIFDRLSPARDVEDVEYPYGFAEEVEAVVRSLHGRAALMAGKTHLGVQLLRDALKIAKNSPTEALDDLRCALATALWENEEVDEAIRLLRHRSRQATASPMLLRLLAALLVVTEDVTPRARQEALRLLRQAADQRDDPFRDISQYNLAIQLGMSGESDEAERILSTFLHTPGSPYSRAWYVKRAAGARHWHLGVQLRQRGDVEESRGEFTQAALWYGRAIRSRPKFRLIRIGRWQSIVSRIVLPPKMVANAADAHREAGHKLRGKYYGWRETRLRVRLARRAEKALRLGHWQRAYALFDWVYIGAGDEMDLRSSVGGAIAAEQWGEPSYAQELWTRARGISPIRAQAFRDALTEVLGLESSLS
jgi:tetratricopeptide (TPR) repeat protein